MKEKYCGVRIPHKTREEVKECRSLVTGLLVRNVVFRIMNTKDGGKLIVIPELETIKLPYDVESDSQVRYLSDKLQHSLSILTEKQLEGKEPI